MDDVKGTINDPELFDRVETGSGVGYKSKNYTGPKAADCIPSELLEEYHKNSMVHLFFHPDFVYKEPSYNPDMMDESTVLGKKYKLAKQLLKDQVFVNRKKTTEEIENGMD